MKKMNITLIFLLKNYIRIMLKKSKCFLSKPRQNVNKLATCLQGKLRPTKNLSDQTSQCQNCKKKTLCG